MYETNRYTASPTMSISGSAAMISMASTNMSGGRFGDLLHFIQAMCPRILPKRAAVSIKVTYLVKAVKGGTECHMQRRR
jgi:hypothetical protein